MIKSDAKILELEVARERLIVVPGAETKTTVRVRNAGDQMDVFALTIEGLDRDWWELSVNSALLFPGDAFASTLTIKCPKNSYARATTYQFAITVNSQRTPAAESRVDGTLEVRPFYDFATELNFLHFEAGSGSYTLTVNNMSNAELTFSLEGNDPEDELRINFDPESPRLAPGAITDVAVAIKPLWWRLAGPSRTHEFTLKVLPSHRWAEPEFVPGQLEVRPRITVPGWAAPTLVGAVVAAAVIAAGVIFWLSR